MYARCQWILIKGAKKRRSVSQVTLEGSVLVPWSGPGFLSVRKAPVFCEAPVNININPAWRVDVFWNSRYNKCLDRATSKSKAQPAGDDWLAYQYLWLMNRKGWTGVTFYFEYALAVVQVSTSVDERLLANYGFNYERNSKPSLSTCRLQGTRES